MTNEGKRRKLEAKLAEYRDTHFSHNSAEEFLRSKGDSPRNYEQVHLSVAYVKMNNDEERLELTELRLAMKAIEKECEYVTNIDYCTNCIAGTGLRPIMKR